MKNIFALITILGFISASQLSAQDCNNFHKKKCYGSDNPMMRYNTQSKSGMFLLGHTSDLVFVSHAGQDYRLSLCQDKNVEEPIKFKVLDGRSKEVLFDSETDVMDVPAEEGGEEFAGPPMFFEFTSGVTKKIIVRIIAPGPPPEEGKSKNEEPDPKSLFCVGVLIENMATVKLGF